MEDRNNIIYVVKIGRIPGIYYTKEDMLKQVTNFDGACVKKFIDIEKAIIFNEQPFQHVKKVVTKEQKEKNRALSVMANKKRELKLKGNIACFIDCEADYDIAISIGAVFFNVETNSIIDKFYSTIKPDDFTSLTPFCKSLTGLTDEEINSAPSFDEVFTYFSYLLEKHNVSDIFSWGNCDKKFLKKCAKKEIEILNNIVDIQIYISMVTSDIIYKKQWGLGTMKTFLNLSSGVAHNALSDALDLCNVYIKWKQRDINFDAIYKEKLKKIS